PRRRHEPADQQERVDCALRGPRGGEQDRLAGPGDGAEGQLRGPGHVLPGDGERQGHRPPVRLRPPAGAAPAAPALARRQVAVQPAVLGHGPPGPDPRTGIEGRNPQMSTTIAQTLDLKGLSCPLPIVKTAMAMKAIESGQLLEALATDPGSVPDFAAWCRSTGNELVEQTTD